jgi:hypothetical protein
MTQCGAHQKNATAPLSHHLAEAGAPSTHGSRFYLLLFQSLTKSGRRDLNPRPPEPHSASGETTLLLKVAFHRGNGRRLPTGPRDTTRYYPLGVQNPGNGDRQVAAVAAPAIGKTGPVPEIARLP